MGNSRRCLAAVAIAFALATATRASIGTGVAIATGLNDPERMSFTDGRLFFNDNDNPNAIGILKSLSPPSNTVTTLFTTPALEGNRGVDEFQVTPNYIYGDVGGYSQMEVIRWPRGGAVQVLVGGLSGGTFMADINGFVYYMGGFSDINQVPEGGGSSSFVTSGGWVRRHARDANGVYYSEYYTNNVRRFDPATATVSDLITGNSAESFLSVQGDHLYADFEPYGGVDEVSTTGGAVTSIPLSGSTRWAQSDGASLIYFNPADSTIERQSLTGGPPIVLASAADVIAMAIGDGNVYWSTRGSGDGDGTIWTTAIPEPSCITLLALVGGVGLLRRR